MIIYGTFTETSVPKLFMAGRHSGPDHDGLLHDLHRRSRQDRSDRGAARGGPRSGAELLRALAEVVPFVLLILGTLGGLYYGVVTTTEAAVVGCVLSILLGVTMGSSR